MASIIIKVSKRKLALNLLGSIAFVLIGIWLLTFQPETANPVLNNPVVKYGAAIICIAFFGTIGIFLAKRLADNRPAFVIDESGITDNSSAIAAGFIPWGDITLFPITERAKKIFILIMVNNPEHYLEKRKGFLIRKSMDFNYKNYGTPLAVSTQIMQIKVGELSQLLDDKLKEYQQKHR